MLPAFLILAHQDFDHVRRLVARLETVPCEIYLHVDSKVRDLPALGPRVRLIADRVDIAWGGFSMVEATLALLRESLAGDATHFVLLSGVDYPIAPLPEFCNYVERTGADHINAEPIGSPHKPATRVLVRYFERASLHGGVREAIRERMNRAHMALYQRTGWRRALPRGFQLQDFHAGSQWFCLRAASVRYILDFVAREPDFVRFCRHTRIPDEFFFQTILKTAEQARLLPNFHYTDWSKAPPPHPAVLTDMHWPDIQDSTRSPRAPRFFARKFSSLASRSLLARIDSELLGTGRI